MLVCPTERRDGKVIDVRELFDDEVNFAEGPVTPAPKPSNGMVCIQQEIGAILTRLLTTSSRHQPVLMIHARRGGDVHCIRNLVIDADRSGIVTPGSLIHIGTRCHHCGGTTETFHWRSSGYSSCGSLTIIGITLRFQDRLFILPQDVIGTCENDKKIEWLEKMEATFPWNRPEEESIPQPAVVVTVAA